MWNKATSIAARLAYTPQAQSFMSVLPYARWVWHTHCAYFIKVAVSFKWLTNNINAYRNRNLDYSSLQKFQELKKGILPSIPVLTLIALPFGELLIPFYIMLFPNTVYYHLLPEYSGRKIIEKAMSVINTHQIKAIRFLRENKTESKMHSADFINALTTQEMVMLGYLFRRRFITGYELIYNSIQANYSRPCIKYIVQMQIKSLLNDLLKEDQMIMKEDYKQFPIWKLEKVVSERGMRIQGKNRADMEVYLENWLKESISKTSNKYALLATPLRKLTP